MVRQTIFFDLDDTLVHCNKYFEWIVDQFVDRMAFWFSQHGITEEQIRTKQAELDVASVQAHGFTTEHFPQSFVDTYEYYSDLEGRRKSRSEVEFLYKLAHSVYEMESEPYPHMPETLHALQKAGHELCLYTGGVAEVQRRKIDRLGLEVYFDERVFIALHKNQEALQSILKDGQFEKARTWMIGNSLRTDILPAIENGIHSIHIPALHEWDYNNVDIHHKPQRTFVRVTSLLEVPRVINRFSI